MLTSGAPLSSGYFKNPVTHNSQSQIRNVCQSRTQCYVLMELLKSELDSVINAKLFFCLEWTCQICMLLTVIAPWIMSRSWAAWTTQYLDIATVHLWEPDTSKSPVLVCSLLSSSTPLAVCPCFIVAVFPSLPPSLPCSLRNWLCCWLSCGGSRQS